MTKSAENTTETKKEAPSGSPVTAATPGMEGKGSPVTAATPPADKSNQPTQTGVNTQSTKPVASETVTKPDPDNPSKATADNQPPKDEIVEPPKDLSRDEERELEAILDGYDDKASNDPATTGPINESVRKLFNILKHIPQDTPDEHPVWGAAGYSLSLGDLRNIARAID